MIKIEHDANRLLRRFGRMPKDVQTGMVRALARELIVLEDQVRTRAGLRWRHGAAGLSGRLTSRVTREPRMGLGGVIGFRRTRGFPYELAQETGAKAKPGRAMAIPVSPSARAAGSPRNMANLAVIKSKALNQALLVESGPRGQMTVHYVLVKSIPPRLKFRETVTGAAPRLGAAIIEGASQGVTE